MPRRKARPKGEQGYEVWRNFHKGFDARKMEERDVQSLKIFEEKSCKKFVDYFVQWTDLFRALNI